MTKYRFMTVVAVLAALTTSGCQGPVGADVAETSTPVESPATSAAPPQTPAPTDTPSAPATPTETATPTATASAGKPELADLRLSSEGLGYVRIGEAVPEVPKDERIVEWKENFCGSTGDGPKPGAWDTQYPTTEPDGNLQFYVEAKEKSAAVTQIYIISDKIRTEHGLGIGSTLADVKALGGVKEQLKGDDFYLDPWVIHGTAGQLVFWVGNDDAEKAQRDIVQHLDLQTEGSEPAFAFEITPCA